jgi:hypothetical protein
MEEPVKVEKVPDVSSQTMMRGVQPVPTGVVLGMEVGVWACRHPAVARTVPEQAKILASRFMARLLGRGKGEVDPANPGDPSGEATAGP